VLGIEGVLGIGTMVGLEAELPNPNASALPEVAAAANDGSELGAGATATNESNCDAGDVPRSLEAPLVSE